MHGVTTSYRVDPVGEYVIGVASGRGYHLRRGRSTHLVRPGQLVVLDPSAPHSGSPAEGAAWAGRLLVIELPSARAALCDDDIPLSGLEFPAPVIGGGRLAQRFRALYRNMERSASALERQTAVLAFLADLAAWSPDARPRSSSLARKDPAVRIAMEYLHDEITRNVSLDELAAVAGTGKYQLVRRFKARTGIPPHSYQVALRVNLARRLLERGERATDVAALAGFVDQSHLTRHFRQRLGMTPARYANATSVPRSTPLPRSQRRLWWPSAAVASRFHYRERNQDQAQHAGLCCGARRSGQLVDEMCRRLLWRAGQAHSLRARRCDPPPATPSGADRGHRTSRSRAFAHWLAAASVRQRCAAMRS
jgi:AraC-like DNA-binding protein